MKRIPKRLSKGTFLEGQNGFSVVIHCVINISRNGCYHGLYLRKLHWFTLEFVQKVHLVVENELSKVGDLPRFSKYGKFKKSLCKSLRISLVYIRIYKGISRISPIWKIEEDQKEF